MNHERLSYLRSVIQDADAAYYGTGEALFGDEAYDLLKEELGRLSPADPLLRRVGSAVDRDSIGRKVVHRIPMGSQREAKGKSGFFEWADSTGAGWFHASHKLDGGSGEFNFELGALGCASTRGDGIEGHDITANALKFRGVPAAVCMIGDEGSFTGSVRGEIMLSKADWAKADPDMLKNPRNLGNGISVRLDGTLSELLTVYAFRAYGSDGTEIAPTEGLMSTKMQAAGFNVPEWFSGTKEEVWAWYERVLSIRLTLDFWIDGLVVKVDNIADQLALGTIDGRPRGQAKLKFPAPDAETVVDGVVITVGHTGAIIPTADLRPVEIGGTTVASALLCNWTEIGTLDVAVGDRVRVIKAGDIIPKITNVVDRPSNRRAIEKPTKCPVCSGGVGHKTTADGANSATLFCLNLECEAKSVGKIMRWIRSLNILGIGDEVLASFIDQLGVKDAADLYTLRDQKDAMANVLMGSGVRLGVSRAEGIVSEIQAKSDLSIEDFIGSLGVDSLAQKRVELIRRAVPGQMDTLQDWVNNPVP